MYPLVTDATSNVVTKINSKRVFYFAFISFNREVVTSPLPSLEILTDCPDERSLTVMFSSFLNDQLKRFENGSREVPLVTICDMSWPIMKTIVRVINNESLVEYIERSYRIVSGQGLKKDISNDHVLITLHLCLSHFMKDISY